MNDILKVFDQFRAQGYTDSQIEDALKKLLTEQKITQEQYDQCIKVLQSNANKSEEEPNKDEKEAPVEKGEEKPTEEKETDEKPSEGKEEKQSPVKKPVKKGESEEERKKRIASYFGETI